MKSDKKEELEVLDPHYEYKEFYKTIRDCKEIYAGTTFNRAIPSAKDGLIVVYRRILYDMISHGYLANKNTIKSATVVGEIIGKLHPHGDSSVYNAIVTLSENWTNNYPVIYGRGNWGNVLGDAPAAYRYTECKLSEFLCDIVEEISPNFVNYIPNFDNTTKEIEYIPFKIPYILVNGIYGIAESYIASVPCHNIGDVVDICIKYINNKSIANEDLVEGFLPDFPNYGIITNKSEIVDAYKHGTKANIKMKATIDLDRENKRIFVRDLPFGMTLSNIHAVMIKKTAEKHAILSKIQNVVKVDPNPIRDGIPHIEFEVLFDKNSNMLEIVRDFEKFCTTKTVPLNFILNYGEANVSNCTIKDIIKNWYRILYITKHRKYGYYSTNAKTKEHIQVGLLNIYDHTDEIIDFIKKSKTNSEIIDYLMKKFKLSQIQAESISNMQLKNLSRVSKETLIKSIEDLRNTIKELDEKIFHIDEEIIADLIKIKNKYNRPRRTLVIDENETKASRTSIPMSNGMLIYSHNQYGIFDTQSIVNGKSLMNGLKSFKIDGKNVKEIVGCQNINNDIIGLILINKNGIAHRIEISDIICTNNWIPIEEEIVAMIPICNENEKIIVLSSNNKIRKFGVDQITKANSNIGNIKSVIKYNEIDKDLILLSESGRYHCIKIDEIPELSKNAVGIIVNLPDEKVNMCLSTIDTDQTFVVSLTNRDDDTFIMRFDSSEFELTNRANKSKSLVTMDGDWKFKFIGNVSLKDKETRCSLIGRYTTSQISMINLRGCESGIDTKKVPVEIKGILQYKI